MPHFGNENIEDSNRSKTFDKAILRKMLPYITPHTWGFIYCFVLMSFSTIATIVAPVLMRRAIDEAISAGSLPMLAEFVGMFALLAICSLFLTYFLTVNLETLGQKILRRMRLDLFDKLLGMPMAYHNENPVGRLVARVESDSESVRAFFTSTTITFVQGIFTFAGILILMFMTSVDLTLRVVIIIPILLVGSIWFVRHVRPLFLEVRRKVADICAFVTENLQGMKVVQLFSQQPRVSAKMDAENKGKFDVSWPAEFTVVWFFNCVGITETIGICIILWYGLESAYAGVITVGIVVMFIIYLQQLYGPIRTISEQINVVQRAFAAGERVFGILDAKNDIVDPISPVSCPASDSDITFENVWFSYKPEEWVLKDVSFTIPKGETWALVGPTGGGKTTILSLILRFYDPQKGRILVGGVDIREMRQSDLRAKFSLVQQDIFLFPGSILDNMRLLDDSIAEETVWRALETVQAEKFVRRLEKGIQTEIAERGLNLSQGERQLLSFARALVFDPQVILLDEATSNVDPATEVKIQEAIERVLEGRTGLVVAHRLATIRAADKILVISDGKIVEAGTHSELIELNGRYATMHDLQFSNAAVERLTEGS
ncbi:MAG: ABC transporter ATP-binding protein [Candidatus Brocadiia bacterium]